VKSRTLDSIWWNIQKFNFVSKWYRQKLEAASHSFGHANWTSSDFANNLNITIIGINHCKYIFFIFQEDLVFVFGSRDPIEWMEGQSEWTPLCTWICILIKPLYAGLCTPTTQQWLLGIFLKGWLTYWKKKVVN
jgi:hypothetical protein